MSDTYNDWFEPSGMPFCDPDMPDSIEGGDATYATGSVRIGDDGVTSRGRVEADGGGGSGGTSPGVGGDWDGGDA